MCGIIGYLGAGNAIENTVKSLEMLEYRGYDSAGIAFLENNRIKTVKSVGTVQSLVKKIGASTVHHDKTVRIGIGHTRWATHGGVTEENAHPHVSNDGKFAVVHNGTIENYAELKSELHRGGTEFSSQTDTEVIPNLLQKFYTHAAYDRNENYSNILRTLEKTCARLKGNFAFAVLTSHAPDTVFACKHGTPPLVIGKGNKKHIVSSDMPTALRGADTVYIMETDETAAVTRDSAIFYKGGEIIEKTPVTPDREHGGENLGEYTSWMEKEIHDIPAALKHITEHYIHADKAENKELLTAADLIKNAPCVHIAACGTSYHAGLIMAYLLEKHCTVRTKVYIASEFTAAAMFTANDVGIVITQSGETADTLTAMNHMRANGLPVIAVCNVLLSAAARGSTVTLATLAGAEFAVASTKSYCAQVLIGAVIANAVGKLKFGKTVFPERLFRDLPDTAAQVITADAEYTTLARTCADSTKIFFLGRGTDYFTALEAALKVKEITYMHCEGYAAGELKHGTLSLVDNKTAAIIFGEIPNTAAEVTTRGGQTHLVVTPPSPLDFVYKIIPAQILALRLSLLRGINPDKPRNLAKSVTVD